MSEFATIVLGVLMPPLISWLKNCEWHAGAKAALSLLVCMVAGALVAVMSEQVTDWRDIAGTAAVIFTIATTVYQTWFKSTDLNATLEEKAVL